jgi:hypothetical protein
LRKGERGARGKELGKRKRAKGGEERENLPGGQQIKMAAKEGEEEEEKEKEVERGLRWCHFFPWEAGKRPLSSAL